MTTWDTYRTSRRFMVAICIPNQVNQGVRSDFYLQRQSNSSLGHFSLFCKNVVVGNEGSPLCRARFSWWQKTTRHLSSSRCRRSVGFVSPDDHPMESFIDRKFLINLVKATSFLLLLFTTFSPPLRAGLFTQAVLIQSLIQCAFAVIIYYGIVQRRGTTEAYLLGWGIIIPLSLYLPFYLLEAWEMHNRVVNLGLSTVMSVIFFRCIEAMYGTTSPSFVANNLSNYVAYYSSIVPFVWDPTTKSRQSIPRSKLPGLFLEIAGAFLGVSLLLSVLKHYDYRPFPSSVPLDHIEWTWEIFSPNHLANSYLHAWLIYGTLKTGLELTAFNENIKGYDTYRLFDQPFLKSQTPTEFWTKRWNMLIRPLLKVRSLGFVIHTLPVCSVSCQPTPSWLFQHGIFRPLREYINPSIALFITFVGTSKSSGVRKLHFHRIVHLMAMLCVCSMTSRSLWLVPWICLVLYLLWFLGWKWPVSQSKWGTMLRSSFWTSIAVFRLCGSHHVTGTSPEETSSHSVDLPAFASLCHCPPSLASALTDRLLVGGVWLERWFFAVALDLPGH